MPETFAKAEALALLTDELITFDGLTSAHMLPPVLPTAGETTVGTALFPYRLGSIDRDPDSTRGLAENASGCGSRVHWFVLSRHADSFPRLPVKQRSMTGLHFLPDFFTTDFRRDAILSANEAGPIRFQLSL